MTRPTFDQPVRQPSPIKQASTSTDLSLPMGLITPIEERLQQRANYLSQGNHLSEIGEENPLSTDRSPSVEPNEPEISEI